MGKWSLVRRSCCPSWALADCANGEGARGLQADRASRCTRSGTDGSLIEGGKLHERLGLRIDLRVARRIGEAGGSMA